MTLVCAPIKRWPDGRPVDLYEVTDGPFKYLYDSNKELKFRDVDWREKQSIGRGNCLDIVSCHNFEETPDLEGMLTQMKERHPQANYYKLATFATSTLDSLRMLHFQREHPEVIGVCMGEKGALTRILGPVVGCPIVYAPLTEEDKNCAGQLLWSELSVIYRFRELAKATPIYGLIGDPVGQSLGHLFHNGRFLYVKMGVTVDELPTFFALIEDLPFRGLSVTAPLKEKVMPFLKAISPEARAIGAVNTLVRRSEGWEGQNTDGKAAVDGLGKVKGKRVVVIGAGGAARAIVYELVRRGAAAAIVNRTADKGRRVARDLGCAFFETVPPCDILINTTSAVDMPSCCTLFAPVVMDVALRQTPFLKKAKEQGSRVIDGFEMYLNQAIAQQGFF